jgi:glycosyltransferase involved in cell wall biosynthesis
MRVLIDYRAALTSPSGVGEYTRQLVSGLLELNGSDHSSVDVTVFSSSWKDRLQVPAELNGVATVDLRLPVSLLNFAWHRLGWPQAEALTDGVFDVAHSLHPLILPSRSAAQVITIHDLNFLKHPERTRAEIRRDYRSLARRHAARADRVLVPSRFTAGEVEQRLGVPAERISVCSPGAPEWPPRAHAPAEGYVLFLGTLEPRKNIGTLLDAYERLLEAEAAGGARVPELLLAGRATPEAAGWLERINGAPLAGRVRYIGYVDADARKSLYESAMLLVQPSFEEGFGIPPLEAMAMGVPVVASNQGASPEVVGDAGLLINTEDSNAVAAAITRLAADAALRASLGAAGVLRAKHFTRSSMAQQAREAYVLAVEHRAARSPRD